MLKAKKKIKKKELKEDQFILTVVKIQDYLVAHVKELSTIALVLVVIIAGTFYVIKDQANREITAGKKFAEATTKMQTGNLNEAIEILKNLSEKYDDTNVAAMADLKLAQHSWKSNQIDDAKKYYEKAIEAAGDMKSLKCAAYAGLGDYYFDQKEFNKSVEMYKQAAAHAVSEEESAYFLYSAALSYIDNKQIQNAQKLLISIIQKYEETSVYLKAEKMLNALGYES